MTYRGKRRAAWLGIIPAALVIALPTPAWSEECMGESPLLALEWDSVALEDEPAPLGEWRLPLSAQQSGVLTEARLRVTLVKSLEAGGWAAKLDFLFPDPKPFGIPFTFQHAEISWATPAGIVTHRLDWSNGCSRPGRSLYPRQSWSTLLPVSETGPIRFLEQPRVRVWGSRN